MAELLGRVPIKRDHWGRYVLPHPHTGKEQPWRRVTTVAKVLEDRYHLEQWAMRNVALGMGKRKDLFARAAACTADDRDELADIVKQAESAAASQRAANLGNALHQFTEQLDLGQAPQVPDPWQADVLAYARKLGEAGITHTAIEITACLPEEGVVGTTDRISVWNGKPVIADLKTGKVEYSWLTIAIQLALYSRASFYWTAHGWEPMPLVNQDVALVYHLPAGQGECTIYEVDLKLGWKAAQEALKVLKLRTQGRQVAKPVDVPEAPAPKSVRSKSAPDPDPENRVEWLRGRVKAIIAAGYGGELAKLWDRERVPPLTKADPTDEQIDLAAQWCSNIEKKRQLPLPPGDPATPIQRPKKRK